MQLAGHGKDERLIQAELPLPPNVGDRIRNSKGEEGVFDHESIRNGKKEWWVRLKSSVAVPFNPDDSEIVERAIAPVSVEEAIVEPLPEQATKPKAKRKPSLPKGIKVGDMVTYLSDGTIGEVTSLDDRHISITTVNGVQNHDLDVDVPKLEIHTHPNQSVVFAIGDRVTLCSASYDVSDRFGIVATVIEKKWDKKIGCTRIKVKYEDGYIYSSIEGAGWFKKIEEEALPEQGFKVGDRVDSMHSGKNLEIVEILTRGFVVCRNADGQTFGINSSVLTKVQVDSVPEQCFKVGDRIKDKDGFIGVIISISDRCINAENSQSIKSWNLEEFKGCLPISIYLGELEHSPLQPETQAKSAPSHTSTSIKTRKKSTKRTSQMSQSIAISETIPPVEELTCLQGDSPVLEPAPQEPKQDLTMKKANYGLNTSDALTREDLDSQSSKTLQGYSIEEWEQSCKDYPHAGTMQNGKLYPLPYLEAPKRDKEFLSLPTLTTGLGSYRNAGATKCEQYLKHKGILQDTQALSPQMMELMFNFPVGWTQCLWEYPKESKEETNAESSLGAPSTSTVPPSSLSGSCTLIEFSGNNIDARLGFLLEQKQKLIASGATPEGIWINCGRIPKRNFEQAVWKSKNPRPEWGDKKSKYIGERGKEAHISAIAQHKAGQELRKIEREIRKLQVKS